MLQAVNISKSYGSEVVLENVSFVVNPGERAGLIGPNGSGKSTLLRIIAGVEDADSGHVVLGSGASVAWIPQGFEVDTAQTLGEAVRRGLADRASAYERLLEVERKMARASGSELDALIEEYGLASDEFTLLGGYDVEYRAAAILQGLGLGTIPDDTPLATLSGGQRTRPVSPASSRPARTSCCWTSPPITWTSRPSNGWKNISPNTRGRRSSCPMTEPFWTAP